MRFVFLGLAGAGKGTQAQLLAHRLSVPYVASGDLFRRHQGLGTELGLLAKSYMDRGELVPDEVTISMVLERLGEQDCCDGFILDGFPRTLEQAVALEEALGEESVEWALYIEVEEDELAHRLSGRVSCRQCGMPHQRDALPSDPATQCPSCGGELYQRLDDQPEVVRRRLKVQRPGLTKLLEHYAGHGKLVKIDGEQSIGDVEKEMLAALARYAAIS